jgi:hypothetical protein
MAFQRRKPAAIGTKASAALTFFLTLTRARALMARQWSARCYGVARQRDGSRQNSIGPRERGLPEEIEFRNNGGVSHVRPQITSFWRNQQDGNFDYLLPSIDHEPIRLDLPSAYILAVAAHMSLFLKGLGDADREAPQVPLLKLFS